MMETQNDYILLNETDNTVTALRDLQSGYKLSMPSKDGEFDIILNQDIPFAHKFSRTHISKGHAVIKYGEIIGIATEEIFPGDYVHIHNIESTRARANPR